MGHWDRRLRKDSPHPQESRHLDKRREVDCVDDGAIDAGPVDPGRVISSRKVIIMATLSSPSPATRIELVIWRFLNAWSAM